MLSKRTVTSGKRLGYQETAFFVSPSPFPNVNVKATQWARPCVPTSDSQNPNINSFFPLLLLICQQIWAGKFVGKVVLSRTANKQSHHCAGWSPLQHFRHLFHLTACLTSAGCILLTQDSVSWTGIGPYRDTMEAFLLLPASSPSCERRASGKGIIQHICLRFFVCVRNPLWVIFPYADEDLHLHL